MALLESLSERLAAFGGGAGGTLLVSLVRIMLPLLVIYILARCFRSLLRERYDPEIWAWLIMPDGERMPLRHWENTIGRAVSSDIVVSYPTVSRSHAALIRDSAGVWTIYELGSTGGIQVAGEDVKTFAVVSDDDCITLGGVDIGFAALGESERRSLAKMRKKPGKAVKPFVTFTALTLFQALLCFQLCASAKAEHAGLITLAFGAAAVAQWIYYLIMRSIRRTGLEVEIIAFFLSTLGLSVAASSVPEDMAKQVLLLLAGIVLFVIIGFWLRGLGRAVKLRWPMAIGAALLLAVNLIFSEAIFGAQNWIIIGGFSIQPSEFVKVAFIYAGAATLDRLFMSRNLWLYIAFSAFCVGALALMGDFGTALIFFTTFLVISFLRSGNLATIALALSGAGLAGFLAFSLKPYIASRFMTWGKVWQYANEGGYQQTRALSAAASGGLFGQGAGKGWLKDIVAADTDLVFCMLSEELGLLVAVCAVLAILILAAFAVKSASSGRSSFYVIAATAAVSMLMVQMSLNVFGSVDILPLTGVTFPFVSRGGSSLISCWCLTAFIKAADTRQNASFTVKLHPRLAPYERESYGEDGRCDIDDGEA